MKKYLHIFCGTYQKCQHFKTATSVLQKGMVSNAPPRLETRANKEHPMQVECQMEVSLFAGLLHEQLRTDWGSEDGPEGLYRDPQAGGIP